ncbi:hypothetical protein K1719_041318 [Acacia pycnantha]|nr:hypothetical protein K1719_041318 [Acacia pycnantha]
MEHNYDRSWMYNRLTDRRELTQVGGPQQYRWMYPFERFLRTLKNKIKNPRYVEGSIAEAYLVEEAAKFASYYYPPEMISRWRGVPRNDDAGDRGIKNQYLIFQGESWENVLGQLLTEEISE